jgi:hypothetical protein
MSVDVSDIITQWGDYYINEGQNMDRLRSAIRYPTVTPNSARPIIVDGEVYKSSNNKMTEFVQQFQKAFTAKGDLNFEPNEIRLRRLKMDVSLYPDDVMSSWAGFLASIDSNERAQWPLIRYMLEQEVIPQMKHDMETKAYFDGVYAAPTPGTPGTTAGTMDGVKKLLDDGLTATTINAVALSAAPDATNMFDMVEEFADGIDPVLDNVPVNIYMSKTFVKYYLRDKRNTHGSDVNYESNKITVDFDENKQLVGLPSMQGSSYIWATPRDNFLYLRRRNGMKTPKIEESKREVFLMNDWYEALGFDFNALVYCYKPV